MKLLVLFLLLLSGGTALADIDPTRVAGIDRIADAHLPGDTRLVDQDGNPARLGDYFGGPPLLFAAVQFNCPNLCGVTLDGLFAGLAGAGLVIGRDYRVVVMSIDPHEGPAEARKSLSGLAERWAIDPHAVHFLSGPAPVIETVGRAMGIRSGWDEEHRQFAHITAVAVTTPAGRLSRWLMGVQFDPRALRLGLVQASGGKVGTLGEQVLLLCYGYDPIHGRYAWVAQRMLEISGAATVAGFFLFLWLTHRQERRRAR